MTDDKLQECIAWYIRHHGRKETDVGVFETFLCGYHHTHPRQARDIRNEMRDLELISIEGRKVIIL